MSVADILTWVFLAAGSILCVIAGIGVLRMPEFYSRCHAASISDSAGAGLILVGLTFQAGFTLVTAKLVMVMLFLWLTSAASTHALMKAAYSGGLKAD